MCQRHSNESSQLRQILHEKDQKIKELLKRIDEYEDRIEMNNKLNIQLNEMKNNVKKLPYSIYKQFLIATQHDGSVIDLIKQKSVQESTPLALKDSSSNKSSSDSKYDSFLLIKLKGDKPLLYLSCNTQIATIDKLKIEKFIEQQKKNYSNASQQGQTQYELKRYGKSPLNNNESYNKNEKLNKVHQKDSKQKLVQLKQEHKKLLIFPPSPKPELKKKQSLTSKNQFSVLSSQIQKLKEKVNFFMKVLSQKTAFQPQVGLHDLSQISPINDKAQIQISERLRQINGIDISNVLSESRWKQQKEQYIDYIQNLQKQLQSYRNHQFSFTDKDQYTAEKNMNGYDRDVSPKRKYPQNKSIVDSLFKTPGLAVQNPASKIQSQQNVGQAPRKHQISKSEISDQSRGYYKNQYHINDSKSRSKSKGSKIIYLRR